MAKTTLKIFLSYAREDEQMKQELDKALVMLKRNKKIEVWQDRCIIAGEEWDTVISQELKTADIVLLLISVDFNNSQYIWDKELAVAMERQKTGSARVIPVILRECEWNEMPYAKLNALPSGAVPVNKFADKDEAYTNIAKGIRSVVEHLLGK